MKLKFKFKYLMYLLIMFFVIGSNLTFSNANYDGYDIYDYYIKNMNVDVEINEKREYIITETIDAYFNENRHGIIRNIPKSSNIEDYNIEDISVENDKYIVDENANDFIIQIGDENNTIIGDKRYIIKYTLKHFADEEENEDFVYLNVLGNEWDVPVVNFTSNITYPENFIFEYINITSGEYGEIHNEYTDYKMNNNNVTITSIKEIPSFSAITVKMSFEEGAFSNSPIYIDNNLIVKRTINVLTCILFVATIILILKSRKEAKSATRVVGFYPPEDMNSVEMGYIYKGQITPKIITSYIYNWANKGYLSIETSQDGKRISLKKMKELDKGEFCEKRLFKKMFDLGYNGVVRECDLNYKLNDEFKYVENGIKYKYITDKRYSKKISKYSYTNIRFIYFIFLMGIALYTSQIFVLLLSNSVNRINLIAILGLLSICFIIMYYYSNKIAYDYNESFIKNMKNLNNISPLLKILVAQFFVYGIICTYNSEDFVLRNAFTTDENIAILFPIFFGYLLTTIISNKRSSYEKEVYGRICGFKEFIETAEKNRLESLIVEDPNYFYFILPYAQALGVTNIWCDKFKNIAVQPSQYYGNANAVSSIDNTCRMLEKTMRKSFKLESNGYSSSSGGGSGGGGGF